MSEPLQSFDWKNSNYDRPTNSWVCGRMCEEGTPCRLGPSSEGGCQLESQCQPEEKGGQYKCSRSAINGGKCKEGPSAEGACCQPDLSCQPRRQLLAKRRILGILAAVISCLFCLIVFSSSSPPTLLSPGKLSTVHAKIELNCSECHTVADGDFASWVHASFDSETALKDSALCLKCHSELGQDALFHHGISPGRLTELTENIQQQADQTGTPPLALQLASLTGHVAVESKLACSTCHREHHGREASLTQLTDLQCQACHVKQFTSFQDGHPPLGDYPYKRRSRIYFDHAAHLNRYFVKDEFRRTMPHGRKPESCDSCHTPDATGRVMLTGSFEKTCASCHESQIKDIEFPGVPFFSLPVIASSVMKSQGEWPRTQGVYKTASLPQMMELLLENDPDYQSGIRALGDIDFRKLSEIQPNQKTAVINIAWSIKKLLYDVSTLGESALKQRLGNRNSAYLQLTPSIVPTLSQAQQIWFPNLSTEMKYYELRKPVPNLDQQNVNLKNHVHLTHDSSGWYISESDFSIRYRPTGHADPLVKGWLDNTVQSETHFFNSNTMWHLLSNPSASGTEETEGALSSGRCLLCHSVERNPENGLSFINWHPFIQQSEEQFTHFSHAPHLLTGQQEKCAGCHTIDHLRNDHTAILQPEYFVRDTSRMFWQVNFNSQQSCTSGFQPIKRQTCVTCHNKSTATQSCLQCHKYHSHRKTRNQSAIDR